MGMILLDGCKGNDIFMHLIRRDQIDRIQGGRNEKSGTRVRPVWNEKRIGSIFDITVFRDRRVRRGTMSQIMIKRIVSQ